jgi:fused signal recognition particle receptor
MEELQKVIRVIKKVIPDAPHKTIITIDATTGQNGLDQVKTFKELVDVNGIIITKLDGTSKGGILVAIASETSIPIYYIGIGEKIEDMDTFNAKDFTSGLLGL